jgi:hypothetical protein
MNTTVAALRSLLADCFGRAEADTALRTLRLAGIIPEGASGHGGCRSAPLDVRQAALCMLALACNVHPKDSPAEAQRIGDFRWTAVAHTHLSEESRREPGDGKLTLLTYLAEAIDDGRGGPPGYEPLSWYIDDFEAAQASPDRMVFSAPRGPLPGVRRTTFLPGKLIHDIGALFGPALAADEPDELDAA